MPEQMKMIKHIQVGINYENSPNAYDLCLEVTVDSKQDLENYRKHPYHVLSILDFIQSVIESSAIVDYEF